MKKSSAMDRAKSIVRGVKCCPIAAAQATKEFISKAMSHEKFPGKKYFKHPDGTAEEYNQYAIFATELTQFIGVNPIGMLDFLTTVYTENVYDCDTKGQGSDLVYGPYITLLACLTPEMLKGFLKMNILTGGFSRRTIFVYGTRGGIVPIPQRPPPELEKGLVEWGVRIQDYAGEFSFGKGAEEWYVDWYTKLQTNLMDISKPTTVGYYSTKHELLFKVCMLIALSETFKPIIEIGHFELAEKYFFQPVEKNLERVFEGSGINPNSPAAVQICRMLESLSKPMNRKHIEAMFFDSATSLHELRDTIQHLVAVGRLAERTITVNGQLMGTVLGTPESIANHNDAQLATFLGRAKGPELVSAPALDDELNIKLDI